MSTQTFARRIALVATTVLAFLIAISGLQVPAHAANTMLVVIGGINVGSPVMATQDSCNGYMEHRDPVVPVTIQASFIGDQDPVGPYATAEWDGGFGSSDDHFGTKTANARSQRFRILVRASKLAGWHGAGDYRFTALVQDVGMAGGFAVKSKDVSLPPPSPTVASVKCTITPALTPKYVLDQVRGAVLKEIQKRICSACMEIKSMYSKFKAYDDALNGLLYDSMVDDPPDPAFQTFAEPVPAQVVTAPDGLTTAQQTAFAQLATRLATDVGTMRAVYATVNRVWGADNAASTYWHRKQLAHLAALTDRAAAGFEAQPALWEAMVDSLGAELPDFTVGPVEVNDSMADLERGLPEDERAVLTELGVTDSEQQKIAGLYATYVQPHDIEERSSREALSGSNGPELAKAMRIWGDWARSAAQDDAPVVTSVTPAELPRSGGTLVTIEGSRLRTVTGVNFGPSDVGRSQARMLGQCGHTSCQVIAPAGHGTVDVVAVAPGGTSRPTDASRVTYAEPAVPHVADVFPAEGHVAGGTQVSVFGSGLGGGRVDFGTVPATEWSCRPTRCTAKAPESGLAGPIDVTVLNDGNRSAVSAAGRFTYLADAPETPPAPTVTGVSPASGTHLGGEQVVLTGDNFTGASSVELQGTNGDARVIDFAVTDDEHITLTTPSMGAGARNVVVYGKGGASAVTAASAFTGTRTAPTITSISPTSGSALGGTRVTLTGTDLTNAFIEVGDGYAAGSVCAPTTCTFTTNPLEAGAELGPAHVSAWTSDGQSEPTDADVFTFTAAPDPVVTGLDPDTGSTAGGDTLVVTGTHLNGGEVSIGGKPADGNSCSASACIVEVPPHAVGDAPVVVTTHAGRSASTAASTYSYVVPPRPVVTNISPRQQLARDVEDISISGRNLTGGRVFFGGVEAEHAECSSAQCTLSHAPTQETARTVDVTVRTAGGASETGDHTAFSWVEPTITSVSPAAGWNDGTAQVTVTGTHLQGGRITFGTTFAPETCQTQTTCTVTAPKRAGTGVVDLVATASDESTRSDVTAASTFSYTARPLPTVTAVSPDRGSRRGREKVTITGTDLQRATITVGTSSATGVDCQPTRCTFTTPYASTPGPVQVVATTSAGASPTGVASTFTYEESGIPTVTSVSPTSGSTAGGTTVTLTGDDLVGTAIRFGGAQQNADCDRTTCTVTTTAHDAGTLRVTAQSDAGTSTATGVTFSFVTPPAPVVTDLTPDAGPASGGTSVTLTGQHLHAAQVSVGGAPVTETCTATDCSWTQPSGSLGDVPVTVTTLGGTATTSFHNDGITLTQVDIPGVTAGTGGGEVVRGIGGDMWFTLRQQHAIGRIRSDGTIVTFPAGVGSRPGGITHGTDGRMWFTEPGTSRIGAMTGDGTLTEYPVPGAVDDVRYIEPGADGRMWFSTYSGAIGAITTSGEVTKYQVPNPNVVPYHLLAGPDGRMWFTEWGGTHIGAVTMDGEFSEYALSGPDLLSWDLKTGPDGRLWFTQAVGRAIAAVDPTTGDVTTYRLPADAANPQGLTFGPDGRFWFVSPNVDRVSAWDPETDEVSYYAMPAGTSAGHTPKYIAMDGRGDLWVTQVNHRTMLKVSGLTGPSAPRVTSVGPGHGAAGDEVVVTGASLGTTEAVTIGGVSTSFEVLDPAHLAVTVPTGSGAASVRVTTAHGTSPAATGAVFRYGTAPTPAPVVTRVDPPSGPVSGGNEVVVTGTNLDGASLKIGTAAATGVACTATRCTAVAPPGSLGTVHVVATTATGSSATSSRDAYTYLAPAPDAPIVSGIAPTSGPTGGGTTVTVTGKNLTGGTVLFGTSPAGGSCTSTSCTVSSPAGGVGPVHVRVVTAGGTSARVEGDRFTYVGGGTTATTSTVSAGSSSVQVGSPVTFTVRVDPGAASGEVTVREGGVALGTAPLTAGTATFVTSALTVGTHEVSADYSGDATHAASSTTAAATVTVTAAPTVEATSTTLEPSVRSVPEGQPVTLTARVAPSAATGRVTFSDGTTVLGRGDLDNGVATLTTILSGAGDHVLRASYVGDVGHAPSVSAPQTIAVSAFQTTRTTLSGPDTGALQSPVTFTATITPATAQGSVVFIDKTTTTSLGTSPVVAGTATLTTAVLGTGRHEILAVFTDVDGRFGASASAPWLVTITSPAEPPPPGPDPDPVPVPPTPPVTPVPPTPTAPPVVGQAPGAPRSVVARATGHRKVVVTWRAPASAGTSAVKSYVVLVYRGAKQVKRITVEAGRTKASVTKLTAGTRYRFVVRARNATGEGPASTPTKWVRVKG